MCNSETAMAATPIQSGQIRHVSANQANLFCISHRQPIAPETRQPRKVRIYELRLLADLKTPTAEGVAFVVTRGDPEQFGSGARGRQRQRPLHAMPGDSTGIVDGSGPRRKIP